MSNCAVEAKHVRTGISERHMNGRNGRIHSTPAVKEHTNAPNSRPSLVANHFASPRVTDSNSRKDGGSIRGYGSLGMPGLHEKVEARRDSKTRLPAPTGSQSTSDGASATGNVRHALQSRGDAIKSRVDRASELANLGGNSLALTPGSPLSLPAVEETVSCRNSFEAGKLEHADGSRGNHCQLPGSRVDVYGGEAPNPGKAEIASGRKTDNVSKSQKMNHVMLRESSGAESSPSTGSSKASAKDVSGETSEEPPTNANLAKENGTGQMKKEERYGVESPGVTSNSAMNNQAYSTRIDTQSLPSSPAIIRPVVRTRNLSEGSFNLIFSGASKEGNLNESRSHAGSPRNDRSGSYWKKGASDLKNMSSTSFRDNSLFKQEHMNGMRSRGSASPELEFSQSGSVSSAVKLADLQVQAIERDSNSSGMNSKRRQTNSEALSSIKSAREPFHDPPQSFHSNSTNHNLAVSEGVLAHGCARQTDCRNQNRDKIERNMVAKIVSQTLVAGNERSPTTGFVTGGSFDRGEIKATFNASSKTVSKQGLTTSRSGSASIGTKPSIVQSSFGNVIRENHNMDQQTDFTDTSSSSQKILLDGDLSIKRGLSSVNAEEVKSIGNEYFKKGHYSEALSLYDRAIVLCPGQASFHSNRAAALGAMGHLGLAVQECQEAIKIDCFYTRAHQRLTSLFVRLGRAGDAKRHIKAAGDIDQRIVQSADAIDRHIKRCLEARSSMDWFSMIKESDAAVVAGADSAPQIFAFKAEALLKLGKTEEAVKVISAAQRLEMNLNTSKNSLASCIVYIVQAKIDIALAKFEEAIMSAEKALKVEPGDFEATALLKKARVIAKFRATGNELFKAGKYFEASAAYGEGLEVEPGNAVLLCNRAACRSYLGLWEKAIEDCDAALAIHSNYVKARLRRAHSNAKLEKWEEALRDYEILRSELPGNLEVAQALFDVQVSLKKSRGEETVVKRFGEVDVVCSSDQFREAISSPGLAVVHFTLRSNDRCTQISNLISQLCKQYPAVNFIKVDIEQNPYLAKMENVNFVPTCKMYKNGLKVKESIELSHQALEQAVQLCIH